MKYKSKAYSPEELRNKWDEAETHFPLSQFVFVVVWQFMIGFFPLMAVDYFIYRLFQYFSIDLWIQILLSPLLFILNYGGYIYFTTFFCKILVNYYNQKSPPREGIFLRSFEKSGMKNPELDYYHLRGVLYKWPVFFSKKSIFPWSVNYVLREVGDNKVHKDAWFGDVYVGLEYANAEENAIV